MVGSAIVRALEARGHTRVLAPTRSELDLLDAVRALRDRGKTVLLVEHDMKVVMGLCETVFVLDHGEKLAEGPPGQIQSDERVIEAYFGR